MSDLEEAVKTILEAPEEEIEQLSGAHRLVCEMVRNPQEYDL